MTGPSAKARAIAEAWIPKKDDFSPFEGVPVIGPAVRRELAALIDAHLKDVRRALGGYVVLGKGKCSIGKPQADEGLAALASLTPEDRE